MNITVIVPSLNPDEKMVNTVKTLLEEGFNDIIVVDDGSDAEHKKYFDEVKVLEGVKLLVHKVNMGKGHAMKSAFKYVLKYRPDTPGVITVDGDGQHLPKDIRRCVERLEETENSIVLGVRDFSQPQVPARSKFGNNLTRGVFKVCGVNISDTQTGLRAIPFKYLEDMIKIKGERYEYETEQLLVIKELGINIDEVVIDTVYLDENESSHFNPVKDSIKIYKVIFKHIGRRISK